MIKPFYAIFQTSKMITAMGVPCEAAMKQYDKHLTRGLFTQIGNAKPPVLTSNFYECQFYILLFKGESYTLLMDSDTWLYFALEGPRVRGFRECGRKNK